MGKNRWQERRNEGGRLNFYRIPRSKVHVYLHMYEEFTENSQRKRIFKTAMHIARNMGLFFRSDSMNLVIDQGTTTT